ncbi:hypothetical protein IFM89_016206 [Coptis chinensis]|uniref:Retrotransposon gag domain-containing protein n=1 Tax=Coptis chinensis TaxID=261450 RepID=A0A835J0K9_9MAGN|nr:hypothetical protein IFM89_016206 [Coptis chinensis]
MVTAKDVHDRVEIIEPRLDRLTSDVKKVKETMRSIQLSLERLVTNQSTSIGSVVANQIQRDGNFQGGPLIQGRSLRIDFLTFEGDYPKSWIFRLEQYQELNHLTNDQMVQLVAVHLTGDAIAWYRWMHRSIGLMSWPQFTRALCSRFCSHEFVDPGGALSKLRQTSTVVIPY